MRRIVFATGNENKMREIREIMRGTDTEIVSMKEAGISTDAVENGSTFAENAIIKARVVAEHTNDLVLADDSGLVIDALGGEPGIYSARYMGSETSYRIKNKNLVDRLNGIPDEKRTARFVCVIAAVQPDGKTDTYEGCIEGRIGYGEAGKGGFGYDPIFFISRMDAVKAFTSAGFSENDAADAVDRMAQEAASQHTVSAGMNGWISTAQLPEEAKNAVSHRGMAMLAAREGLL